MSGSDDNIYLGPNVVAEEYHTLISGLQNADVEAFERRQMELRAANERLRQQQREAGDASGLTQTELLQAVSGEEDEETARSRVDAEIDRVDREAAAAVAAKGDTDGPQDRKFPKPPLTVR